ncbi:MAG: phosphatidylcholine synthase [Rhodobacteraceae bacterium]|nr:phosphatidylcholine synthase [Paracoccaceae bacterium]
MKNNILAFSVHLFTATGAIFALFAMLAAGDKNWSLMFLWLLGALIVDGIDGPLARHFNVKKYAANWDGELLDLIIDYLTYVFIPAYALTQSDLLPEWEGWIAAIVIIITGVVYFADTRMKTADYSFSGFPGCWNMVVLVLFALSPPAWVSILIIAILALAQFFGLKFIHPVRTVRWRPVSLTVMLLWTGIALWIGWTDFDPTPIAHIGLLATSLYLMTAGILQQLIPAKAVSQ